MAFDRPVMSSPTLFEGRAQAGLAGMWTIIDVDGYQDPI